MSEVEALRRAAETHLARYELPAARAAALRAHAMAGGDPFVANLLGRIEEADNQHAAARAYFEAAVISAPSSANFRASLANSFIHSGEFDRARAELHRALALSPHHAGALQLYGMITRAVPGDDLLVRLKAAIDAAGGDARKVSKLHYILGKALDDLGEYDDAFAAFQRANELRPSAYSAEAHEVFAESVKSVWTEERLKRLSLSGFKDRSAAFIIGMPRSGSTLLQQKLAADHRVEALGESGDIAAMSAAMERSHPRKARYPEWCVDMPDGAWSGFGELYLRNARARRADAALYVNKNLFNWLFAGIIKASLPQALLVEIRRNALDACLSCYFTDLHDAHNYAVRLDSLAHMHRLCAALMRHWRAIGIDLALVRYEALVADVAGTVAQVLERGGLEADAQAGGAIEPAAQTFSAWQVRQPIYTHALARWKNYEKHLGPLIDALGPVDD